MLISVIEHWKYWRRGCTLVHWYCHWFVVIIHWPASGADTTAICVAASDAAAVSGHQGIMTSSLHSHSRVVDGKGM